MGTGGVGCLTGIETAQHPRPGTEGQPVPESQRTQVREDFSLGELRENRLHGRLETTCDLGIA